MCSIFRSIIGDNNDSTLELFLLLTLILLGWGYSIYPLLFSEKNSRGE